MDVAVVGGGLAGLAAAIEAARAGRRVTLNGGPAAVLRFASMPPPYAPVIAMKCRLDREGRIAEVWNVSASRKLSGLDRTTPWHPASRT